MTGGFDQFDDFEAVEEDLLTALDESLDPRGPDHLFEVVAGLGVRAGGLAVDVGCGRGEDGARLAEELGVRVVGVDPVPSRAAGVDVVAGRAEELPVAATVADLVWCKESLMFAVGLDVALAEIHRVLRPGAPALVYQVMTGPRMGDEEARRFWEVDLAYGPARSVRPADLEAAATGAGLVVEERIDYASEWGERGQELRGTAGRRLLHAARLLRDPDRYAVSFGEANTRVMLGDALWHVYRMIGLLHGAAFVLRRPAD